MEPFVIIKPKSNPQPILISIPHCGVAFPPEIVENYDPDLIQSPDDTDWFVDQLYEFASEMGITIIKSVYSRWVIDLNRDPESKPLYDDGRIITALVPLTTFEGQSLYKDSTPDDREIQRRVETYYQPYHNKVGALLNELRTVHSEVLLWEAHSIRQFVPTINPDKFPDLILGDADGTSASDIYISETLSALRKGPYEVAHNHPFKGGFITRKFGQPQEGIHALQLEMTKLNYMKDNETDYDTNRASKMQELLKIMFEGLLEKLNSAGS